MKWIRRALIGIAILVCGIAGTAFLTALRSEHPVGFRIVKATDTDGQAFAVGVWYPTQARPWPTTLLGTVLMSVAPDAPVSGSKLPLAVISHGNGGGITSHADLALSLAGAGYVVAAPMHTGDNYADQSAFGTVPFFGGRTRELRATVDHMLGKWQDRARIDAERIGAFGFSMGGFTVLTAVGAEPDLRIIAKHCTEAPEFACDVLRKAGSPLLKPDTPTMGQAFLPDPRIKAAVVAAPGFGFTMAPNGLAKVRVPIQLWSAENDHHAPDAGRIHEALASRVEFHPVPGASHLSFLAPCGPLGVLLPADVCTDPGQFDRQAFHANMNASVLAFFEKNMKHP